MPAYIDTLAYRGETPWHGLGTAIPDGLLDVDEIRKLAGLMWEPAMAPMTYFWNHDDQSTPNRALVRDDTGAYLSTVGSRYTPIRNEEIIEFFRAYCDAGDLTLETVGSIEGGRHVWALAAISEGFTLPGDDRVDGYVLLTNSHVYGRSATAKLTMVRVVCYNTWQAALSDTRRGKGVAIHHVGEFDADRRKQVQEQLGIAREQLTTAQHEAELLVQTRLTQQQAQRLLVDIFVGKPETQWDAAPRSAVRVLELYNGAAKGAALPSADGTAWGLFNAVTQRVDWEAGRTDDARLRSAWLGGGAVAKRRALKVLTTFAKKGA